MALFYWTMMFLHYLMNCGSCTYLGYQNLHLLALSLWLNLVCVSCFILYRFTLEKLPENKNYLSTAALKISGEPIEKLFLWGQSSCVFTVGGEQRVLTFGGFGGPGRHSRRNCSLLLDHKSGSLTEMICKESPSPRMGHTVTSVGNSTYVIGGRGGPSEILDDVWVLQSTENAWLRLECIGNIFRPRYV